MVLGTRGIRYLFDITLGSLGLDERMARRSAQAEAKGWGPLRGKAERWKTRLYPDT